MVRTITKMVIIDDDGPFQCKDFNLHTLVGGRLALLPTVFSADNSKAFIVSGGDVIGISVSSGNWEYILTHSTSGNRNEAIVGLHFEGLKKLITLTKTGLRFVWNTENGTILSVENVDVQSHEILRFHHCYNSSDVIVCKNGDHLNLFVHRNEATKLLFSTERHVVINERQIALTDEFLVVCDKRSVFIYFLEDGNCKKFVYTGKMQFVEFEQTYFVTAAACRDVVAASMQIGRVFMWDNISKQDISSPTRTVHWHQTAPNLVITPFGSLVSGGMEATIVKYSLNKTKESMSPSFLPHLQANIMMLSLSDDGSILSVILEDNSVHFILLATMTVLASPKSIYTRRESVSRSLLPLLSDPFHPDAVVVSPYPGKIHWIDVSSGFTMKTVDLANENALPYNGNRKAFGYSDVVSVSLSNALVVTSISRIHSNIPMNWLKFWSRTQSNGSLRLEFECDCGGNIINFVRVTADSGTVLTADSEGNISCWHRKENNPKNWLKSKSVTFQDMKVCYASQFKESLIALIHTRQSSMEEIDGDGAKGLLVIWDVSSGTLPLVQHCCSADDSFVSAEWNPKPSSAIIFLSTSTYVCGYNIYSSSLTWMINNLSGCPKIGVTSEYFYFFVNEQVYVFKEADEQLIEPMKFECPGFHAYSSVAVNRGSKFKIVFSSEEGYTLLSKNAISNPQLEKSSEIRKSAFARLDFPANQEAPKIMLSAETRSAIEMLAGPTHALPPVSLLAPSFIEACLLPRKQL